MKRVLSFLFVAALSAHLPLHAATTGTSTTTTTHHSVHRTRARVHDTATARRHIASLQHSERVTGTHVVAAHAGTTAHLRRASLHHRYYERFTASSFAVGDLTSGDVTS